MPQLHALAGCRRMSSHKHTPSIHHRIALYRGRNERGPWPWPQTDLITHNTDSDVMWQVVGSWLLHS